MAVPYSLDDCSFVVEPEGKEPDSSSSIFLFQDCFGYLWSFVFPHKLYNFCSNSVKKKNAIGNLIELALNLYTVLGSTVILIILILLIQES